MNSTENTVPAGREAITATRPAGSQAVEAAAHSRRALNEALASGTTPGQPGIWVLAHRPESAGVARRVTRDMLQGWGVDEECADLVLLVVSELVTNAVEHALPVALRVEQPTEGTVHIEVDDGGPAVEEGAWAATGSPEEHGRGSHIVASLATAHGTRSLLYGTSYWVDLPLAA